LDAFFNYQTLITLKKIKKSIFFDPSQRRQMKTKGSIVYGVEKNHESFVCVWEGGGAL
jgi:hypothetical protein